MARVKYVKPRRSQDPSLQPEEKSQRPSKGVKTGSVSGSSSTPGISPAYGPVTTPEANPITPAASATTRVSVPRTIANDDKYTELCQTVMNGFVLRPVTAWRPMRVDTARQTVPVPELGMWHINLKSQAASPFFKRMDADRRRSPPQTHEQVRQADVQPSQQPSQSQATVMEPKQSSQKQTGGRRSREVSSEDDVPSPKRRRSDG